MKKRTAGSLDGDAPATVACDARNDLAIGTYRNRRKSCSSRDPHLKPLQQAPAPTQNRHALAVFNSCRRWGRHVFDAWRHHPAGQRRHTVGGQAGCEAAQGGHRNSGSNCCIAFCSCCVCVKQSNECLITPHIALTGCCPPATWYPPADPMHLFVLCACR